MTSRKDWGKTALGERVQHLAEIRRVSLNRLGARAGLASSVISRLAGKAGREAGHPGTARRLAEAWGCSLEWLAYGIGQPEDGAPRAVAGGSDPFPHRTEAARLAREAGLDDAVVTEVEHETYDLEEDRPVLWWIHQIEARALLPRADHRRKKARG